MVKYDDYKKEKIIKLFDERSGSFDNETGRSMTMLTQLLLREINLTDNPMCLDVGCGTGISTFELYKKIQDNGTIIGIDISPSMIEVAKKNASERGLFDIEFKVGDAEQLHYPDSMFDLVLCNMTLHYLPNKLKALKEMSRVLKPGGQMALHFNGGPVFKEIIDVGISVAKSYPEYPGFMEAILDYRSNFLGFEDAVSLIEGAGFRDHRTFGRQVLVFMSPDMVPTVGESWDLWKTGLSLNARYSIREELVDTFTAKSGEKGFKFTYFTIISIGKKQPI